METIKCNNCGKLNSTNRVLCIDCNGGLWSYSAKQAKRTEKESNKENNKKQSRERNTNKESNYSKRLSDDVYYGNVLELQGKITKLDIKKQYYKMIAKYHPDKVLKLGKKIQKLAENESKIINEAYSFFKNKYNIK
tara:strand:- start:905 stop:1312 length:408 start_codon:yes stop_codon:yes gene_type:complete